MNVINPIGKAGPLSIDDSSADRFCRSGPSFKSKSGNTKRLTGRQRGIYDRSIPSFRTERNIVGDDSSVDSSSLQGDALGYI